MFFISNLIAIISRCSKDVMTKYEPQIGVSIRDDWTILRKVPQKRSIVTTEVEVEQVELDPNQKK